MNPAELITELNDILRTMEVPEARLNDTGWLMRNLGIRNGNHPDFQRAIWLVKLKHRVERRHDEVRGR